MAKEKVKGAKGVPNKHLHARTVFLQKAAQYMAEQQCESRQKDGRESSRILVSELHGDGGGVAASDVDTNPPISTLTDGRATLPDTNDPPPTHQISPGLASYMCSQLRQVALKSQIRLAPTIKNACCKRCNAVLIEGQNCHRFIENLSRGGKKPHANVTVLACDACGAKKRFPTEAVKQTRKAARQKSEIQLQSGEGNQK